jgi:hypothetical protein
MQRPRMNGDADRNTLTVGQIGNVECEPKLASAVSSRQRTRDRSVRTMSSYGQDSHRHSVLAGNACFRSSCFSEPAQLRSRMRVNGSFNYF